ncbi:GNAT family N-acetyltransferase [Pseudosulfitobacter sp. SM2401]|uniref:GNAT family N-acetyltransferase n=1 Tax=Pseudosulfitobacter sp. SM2401 TaxID=3350098 RepID=UPI0036F37DC7
MRLMALMFDAAPTTSPIPLQQSAEFEATLRHIGRTPLRLQDGRLVLRRKFGPLQVNMLTRAHCESIPRDLNGIVLIAPDSPICNLPALPLTSPATVAELDLSPDLKTLHANLKGKWRNRLRHAQSHHLRITRQNMPTNCDHWILKAEQAQQRRLKYCHWPAALTSAFAQINTGDAKLFTAHYGSDIVAGLLVLRHGSVATYHIGHTSTAGRIVSAQTLLLWSAITWAQSKGIARMDLGVIDTETSAGLARFKLGTGAQTRKLGGTWLWHRALSPITGLGRIDRGMMM